jgi:hypothetical protein
MIMVMSRMAAFVLALAAGPSLAQQGTQPPGDGARPPAAQPTNRQRARLFPPGRCDQTRAAVAIDRGEVGVMTRGTLDSLRRDGTVGYTVGEPGCRVRILIVPEAPPVRDRRAPAVPQQEPFRR